MPEEILNITHPQLVAALTKPGKNILESLTAEDCNKWHVASCIPSEGGELFDAVKREVIYRKPADRDNIIEELGDLEFYMEAVRTAYSITREETLKQNIAKLSARYKALSYSDRSAQERADKKRVRNCGKGLKEDGLLRSPTMGGSVPLIGLLRTPSVGEGDGGPQSSNLASILVMGIPLLCLQITEKEKQQMSTL